MIDQRAKTAGAAVILNELIRENPIHERNAAKRVLAEVVRAWPGDANRLWWKWFSEAAINLGLRTKTLDCSVEEAIDLARNHAQIVCYREIENTSSGGGEWLAVLGTGRRRYEVLLPVRNPLRNNTLLISNA